VDSQVKVERRTDGAFAVEVGHGRGATHHVVTVPAGLAAELGHPDTEPAELVELSFAFLLEREPATSILRRFGLEVIERYFPEYRQEMERRLG
jgi:hypothetical protein